MDAPPRRLLRGGVLVRLYETPSDAAAAAVGGGLRHSVRATARADAPGVGAKHDHWCRGSSRSAGDKTAACVWASEFVSNWHGLLQLVAAGQHSRSL